MTRLTAHRPVFSGSVTQTALVAVFAAISLASNYAMIGIVNVKLMDTLVFLAAFLFGLRIGVGVAVVSWGVYGFINPYGADDLILLSFLVAGECFYAITGFALRRTSLERELPVEKKYPTRTAMVPAPLRTLRARIAIRLTSFRGFVTRLISYGRLSLLFGTAGLLSTLAYDVLTNFASWLFKTPSLYSALVIGLVTGAPFALVHEVSNLFFFATIAPATIIASRRLGHG
ncbi:hypothetical protein E6H36_03615 [Candidatus Bathyarchaeota archaeon]|nr:MAG: hypothetical protein E6H36_03615 [Candidatus Bathyarchaeota archaeon]TMI31742.1 MAG: hypothetical protein E6H29_03250 [Candidatus Bathyarchaeota archaeon]